jgi:hypothetical protein
MDVKKKTIKETDDQKEKPLPDNESNAPSDNNPAPTEGEKEDLNPAGNKDNRPEEQIDGE